MLRALPRRREASPHPSVASRRYISGVSPHPVIPAVVTALNLNGLGVVRCLGRHGVRVIGVHGGEKGPELRSRYLDEIWEQRPGQDLAEVLLEHAPSLAGVRPVVMAITDDSVESIARAHDRLVAHYRVPMGDAANAARLLSKEGVDAAARTHRMPVPATRTCGDEASLRLALRELRPPFILKPQEKSEAYARSGAKKAFRLDSADEVLAAYATFSGLEPRVVVQEFIPGTDADVWFCLVAIGGDGRTLGSFVGHKIRQWPPHCGGTASCEPIEEQGDLARITGDFFRGERLCGLGSIEFKRDPRDGRFYMIEPTVCRTDWQSAVADDNGVPIPFLVWCDATDTPLPRVRRKWLRRRWVHLNSDRRSADYYRSRGELGLFSWMWSIRPLMRPAYWAVDDPAPGLAIVGDFLRRGFRKVGRKIGLVSSTADASDPAR